MTTDEYVLKSVAIDIYNNWDFSIDFLKNVPNIVVQDKNNNTLYINKPNKKVRGIDILEYNIILFNQKTPIIDMSKEEFMDKFL